MFTNFYKNIIYILHHLNIHHWWSDQSSWSWLYMSIIDDQFSWWFHEDLELKPWFCSLTAPAAQHLDGLSSGMEAVSKRVELRLCQKIATAHLWSRYTRKSVVFGLVWSVSQSLLDQPSEKIPPLRPCGRDHAPSLRENTRDSPKTSKNRSPSIWGLKIDAQHSSK